MIRFVPYAIYAFCFAAAAVFIRCSDEKQKQFVKLSPEKSGITFENRIEESPETNILTYEYTYNGGGVAAADFNNDGLCDIFFTGNTVPNKLYLNHGDLEFKDITEQAGVGGRPLWKTGVTAADVNGDGWQDIYVCYSGPDAKQSLSNQLFINNQCEKGGVPTFTERTREYGLDAEGTYSTQASFFDYDRDGDLDMFLINHGNHFYSPFTNTNKLRNTRHPQFGNRLYRNEMISADSTAQTFTEVSQEAGIHGGGINFGLGVSVSDINLDGWPDIFVTNDYEEQDFLYLNNQNGTFTESSKRSFGHLSRNGMGTDIADFNNDGRPDLIELDMWPEDNYRQKLLKGPDDFNRYNLMIDSGFHHQQMRNTLQMNAGIDDKGIPVFCEIGQLAGVSATDWSWAPLFADLDNDGFKDLFVSNGYLRDFTSMDFLKYTVEEARNKARSTGAQLQVYELVSQMGSTKTNDYVFRNNGGLKFSDHTAAWGLDVPNLSFGASFADLDNDGDLELITNNTNEPSSIWVNQANHSSGNNYLRIKLIGSSFNSAAVGAKVFVETGDSVQMLEQFPARGYQSSVEPVLHFGLAGNKVVDKVKVIWPDGTESQLSKVNSNQVVEIKQSSASRSVSSDLSMPTKWFRDVSDEGGIDYVHVENPFNDFDHEPLAPYQLSRLGPALASGDVNMDGTGDLFIGGAMGQAGVLYVSDGAKYRRATRQPWNADAEKEDTGATFFDVDTDGDLDLFVVSGGNEFPGGSVGLDDRLYINEGAGKFSKALADATVTDHASGSCVAAADFDKDGDTDLFVGGRVSPGNFPMNNPGAILRNETRVGKISLVVATNEVNPDLRTPGMVTDACWTDFNNDSWPDLMIVGHWMPVRLFENQQGKLLEVKNDVLSGSNGLWNRITPVDFDKDGDTDYVLGNAGSNIPWRINDQQPLTVYYGDFNADEKIDPILCYSTEGKEYPLASRDEMLGQLTTLRKKFKTYDSYARATIKDILEPAQLAETKKLRVTNVESSLLENLGNKEFRLTPLPPEAQISGVNAILTEDVDGDGFTDILLAGNFYPWRTQYGRSDASLGLVLRNDGKGAFQPVRWGRSGFFATGDVRDMVWLRGTDAGSRIAIGRNNDAITLVEWVKKINH